MMSLNKNSSLKDSQEQTSVRFNEQNLFEVVSGLRLKSHKILSLAFFFLSSRRSAHDSPHASEQSEEENERETISEHMFRPMFSVHVAKVRPEW